jgi:predicted branched-subunit amino acid permease
LFSVSLTNHITDEKMDAPLGGCQVRLIFLSVKISPAVRMGIGVSIATGLYGISFGALSVAAGLSLWQTQFLSLVMFTGGSQFAFVGALAGGWSAVGAAILLSSRNGIYAATLNGRFHPAWYAKPLFAQLTTDESFAVSSAQTDAEESRRGYWSAGVGVFLLWNLFTFVGALVGDALADPRFGLDGAAVAAFVGLLWPRLKDRDSVAIAVFAGFLAAVFTPVLPPGVPMLIVALVTGAVGFVMSRHTDSTPKWFEKGSETNHSAVKSEQEDHR